MLLRIHLFLNNKFKKKNMVKQYLVHSKEILSSLFSEYKENKRTGISHISLFGYQNRYDLREGFPLITTKRMAFKSIVHELIWFMKGEKNIKYLVDNNVHIWDDNAFDYNFNKLEKEGFFKFGIEKHSEEWFEEKEKYIRLIKEDYKFAETFGDLGPIYGTQWRHWKFFDEKKRRVIEIDQFRELIDNIKENPTAKRHIISAWNPGEVQKMALPPCHTLFHVNTNNGKLDLLLYQRSCDMFLGVPFNIASYAMLTNVIAQQTGLEARYFIHTFGDSHFYCGAGERAKWYKNNIEELKEKIKKDEIFRKPGKFEMRPDYLGILEWINNSAPAEEKGKEGQDHVTAILEQLSRETKPLPKLKIANKKFDELSIEDFVIENYYYEPAIKRAMAV